MSVPKEASMKTGHLKASRLAALCGAALAALLGAWGPAARAQQAGSWSGDSRLVAVIAGPKAVEVYDLGARLVWRRSFERSVQGAALSPDGRLAACAVESEGLWIVDLSAGSAVLAHKLQAGDSAAAPVWSPDGAKVLLVFTYNDPAVGGVPQGQRPKAFLVKADGSGAVELKP
jgi:hypothetical protein